MGITIHRANPVVEEGPLALEVTAVERGRFFAYQPEQQVTEVSIMADERICIDKDGNEVDCESTAAVRQLTHDDAKAFRKAQNKEAKQVENKGADDQEAGAVVESETDNTAEVEEAPKAKRSTKAK